jgi:hypothetical protein
MNQRYGEQRDNGESQQYGAGRSGPAERARYGYGQEDGCSREIKVHGRVAVRPEPAEQPATIGPARTKTPQWPPSPAFSVSRIVLITAAVNATPAATHNARFAPLSG